MDFSDRVALITGAKRIGAVVAVELARRGADIALSYNRSKRETQKTAADIERLGRRAYLQQADLTDAGACDRLVSSTVEALGRLDVLINMASLYVARPLEELTVDEWDANLAVDLRSAFLCSRAAAPYMRRAGGGNIINFSDWLAKSGRPRYKGYLPYYVAKAAVIGLTEGLALEYAADKIRVNAIAPGPIVAPPETTDEELKAVETATPLGQWGGEMAIAEAVIALLGCGFVTGETVRVDGGRHVK
jgi:NAD(P)-dependent dehydrogenase (short-subunit alcohol dehydrogenase family)